MNFDEMLAMICIAEDKAWWEVFDAEGLDEKMQAQGADLESMEYAKWSSRMAL